jgi:hypothetical protein
MRKTKLKRKSRTPLAKAKTKLWKVLKQVISIRDGDKCISCDAEGLKGYHKQGGHFIPSSSCGGFLRYDLRNVWIQCSTCNLYRSGAGAEYTRALEKKFSTKFVDKLIADKQVEIKLDLDYLEKLTAYYESLLHLSSAELLELTKKYNGFKN